MQQQAYKIVRLIIPLYADRLEGEMMMGAAIRVSRKSFQRRLTYMIEKLRAGILDGTYAPGSYLPAEKELVARFQLSNKSVRKGLEQLVAEGLVVKIDRVGSMVTEAARAAAAVTISLGYHPSIVRDCSLPRMIEDFASLYPNIRIHPIELDFSGYNSVKSYLQNGLVDVVTINNMEFMGSVEGGWVELLEPLDEPEGIYGFANAAFAHGGSYFANPVIFSPIVLAYNRGHFAEAGLPEPDSSWTWSRALYCAEKLTIPRKRFGLYFHLLSDNRWPAILLQGDEPLKADAAGELRLEGTKLLDSIRLCKQMFANRELLPHYLSESNNDVSALFMQGKVSMMLTNYMTLNAIKQTTINYDLSPLPNLNEARSLLNVIGLAVSRQSKGKKAAKLFADYCKTQRAQRIIREHTLSIPARKETAEQPPSPEELTARPSRYFLFREIMHSFRLHRELHPSLALLLQLKQHLKGYWSGMSDEQQLCEQVRELMKVRTRRSGG